MPVKEGVTRVLHAPSPGSPTNGGAFDALFIAYQPEIHRFVQRIIGTGPEVDDLTQETFTRALRAFPRFDGRYPRAWLYRIAAYACADHLRHVGRERALQDGDLLEIAAPEADTADAPLATVQLERLADLVSTLPPRQRQALSLRFLDGLSYEQVARRMGGKSEAARANVYQALRRLRASWATRSAANEGEAS